MHYDPLRRAYVDDESGAVVFHEDEEQQATLQPTILSPPQNVGSSRLHRVDDSETKYGMIATPSGQKNELTSLEADLYDMHLAPDATADSTYAAPPENAAEFQDWSFARTLQALEFEIHDERAEEDDFTRKEYRASRSCRRQLLTISFFICVVQIALLIVMIQMDGYDPSNSVMGPPATTLVRFGAKEAGLIVERNEWWRLLSSVMLHAGIWHIIPNVAIQLRVGGYLNLVFGTAKWFWIYFMSGIFGSMMSCVFLPSAVGVGSSGALMGMLASWVVWIIFRWKKIPPDCHKQRNCQLMIVMASIVITLATSAMPNVDWAAHLGGALQGLLWGIVLLSNELDNTAHRNMLRASALILACGLFGFSLYYMLELLHPTTYYFSLWDANDDWH